MDIHTLADKLATFERSLLNDALRATSGSVSAAARYAGIDRNQFYRRAEAVGGVDIEGTRAITRRKREAARTERLTARETRRATTRSRLIEARAGATPAAFPTSDETQTGPTESNGPAPAVS